ncbi:MAG: hypothetical protein Q8O52_01805 [Sulfuritalea sp.]|nr:hypothetical protein [Sulfuritalea sp.]
MTPTIQTTATPAAMVSSKVSTETKVSGKPHPSKKGRKPEAKTTTAQKLDAIGIDQVCVMVAGCTTLQVIADGAGVSKGPLINWLAQHADQYARVRAWQADKLAEDILSIADDASRDIIVGENGIEHVDHEAIARSRLRVDARKWLAAKMAPKKYGERLDITAEVATYDLTEEQLMERARVLAAKIDALLEPASEAGKQMES